MNKFINGLQSTQTNYARTTNGALAYSTTGTKLYDMFALGGAYRNRSDADCVNLFKAAYDESPMYALKCLFYLRDVRGGAGERRFFRVCLKWLAGYDRSAVARNMEYIPEYGRWDDLYELVDTPLEKEMWKFMEKQFRLDCVSKTPSLLAKWMKSANTSSAKSCELARKTYSAFGLTERQYRKTLSVLRQRINVLERLMSENRWDEIQFDKIPSKAGLVYRNAFARRDIIKEKYKKFAMSDKKVNAATLTPYDCVKQAIPLYYNPLDSVDRVMVNKYWNNLTDYFKGKSLNGLVLCDTSGSMHGTPIQVAIALTLYCAQHNTGAYKNKFITFESQPHYMEVKGVDFVDQVRHVFTAPWDGTTDLTAAFDLLLNTAIANRCKQEEIPSSLIIVSDMQINHCLGYAGWYSRRTGSYETEMEAIRAKWARAGYKMPKLVFWNVNAVRDTILENNPDETHVSGFSASLFEQILSGKTNIDLMYDKLNSERYKAIR